MSERIGQAIGALLVVIVAIAAICVLWKPIVLTLIGIGAPVALGYWLRKILSRYSLSLSAGRQCILVGGLFFCLPLLLSLVSPAGLLFYIWYGIMLGMSAAAILLTYKAYSQVIWPYHRSIWSSRVKEVTIHWNLWRHRWPAWLLDRRFETMERWVGHIRQEHGHLSELGIDIARNDDPAFWGQERMRWEREYSLLSFGDLCRRYDQIQGDLGRTMKTDPQFVGLVLEAATMRLEALSQMMVSWSTGAYEASKQELARLHARIAGFEEQLRSITEYRMEAQRAIRQLRGQRVTIQ